ncbi:uncharacterized protein BYT42DRAFT_560884 [Radiomyces spectabilis]|uniref:uncharacterized protein n=1 Tax=Radiomyces spectabilis TaxID=64574 RepID=UPI00221FC24C|nr:uncharacterized protein BYT42DRAFT_560884 [Radiomyces spectabilis]KAI8388683.1 hypothetical protein BYT42DRAFT_560884 [Radiomyces spectabilis]
MENNNKTVPLLCIAGCGFYGNAMYNNMCSQCYKLANKGKEDHRSTSSTTTSSTSPSSASKPLSTEQDKNVEATAPIIRNSKTTSTPHDESQAPSHSPTHNILPRKHPRSPSPVSSPLPHTVASSPASTSTGTDGFPSNSKPAQTNKGRCFKCRVKIPLAKQAANKCRCEYIFCDSHRYPDRHDCEIDYAKLDRDILAKNNPKLHQRPKGGRSFQRIDSL